MDRTALYVKKGDLSGPGGCSWPQARRARRTGVRAPIVVMKRGNARGAKGRRKVDAERTDRWNTPQ